MKLINKIKYFFEYPPRILLFLDKRRIITLKDEVFLKYMYKSVMGQKLNLNNPQTFNEKLQWLKLNDRKDIYTTMVDKYEVKKYVADIIGEEHIIPTIGIYDKWDDIDFSKLPNQFVIKCTHDSGGVILCKDKEKFNIKFVKSKIEKLLKKNFFFDFREWPYKNVKPRIIIEEFIGENLIDYRVYCFNGKAKYIYMYLNNSTNCENEKPEPEYCNIYDLSWNLQTFHQKSMPTQKIYEKPKEMNDIIKYAEKISSNIHFCRVDFYIVNQKILFGEATFFPGAGLSPFNPKEWDYKVGKLITLPEIKRKVK